MSEGLGILFNLLGGLAVFLFGLRYMSESLQQAAGERLRTILRGATGNRFSGTLSGFAVTTLVQSSSATTVMVVGFASAGLLSLTQSLGVIFGANIGTTTTAWLLSLFGFEQGFKIAAYALPVMGISFFLQFSRNERLKNIGRVGFGFGMLFLGLDLVKSGVPPIDESAGLRDFVASMRSDTMMARVLAIGVGTLLTVALQSSSATMVLTLTVANAGYIDFPTAAALVLGENIGTTVTANIAAIGAPSTARQAARGHFLFNVFGVLWVSMLFFPILNLVDSVVPGDGFAGEDVEDHLAAFHTLFNITNTLIMLPFINQLANIVRRWVKDDGDGESDLVFLKTELASTPELAIEAAWQEVSRMAEVVKDQFVIINELVHSNEPDPELLAKVIEIEDLTDRLETLISDYLVKLSSNQTSDQGARTIVTLVNVVTDLERIGDNGEKIAKALRRAQKNEATFSEAGVAALNRMSNMVSNILDSMVETVSERRCEDLAAAEAREVAINKLRSKERRKHERRLLEGSCNAKSALYFVDVVGAMERVGDHAINVISSIDGDTTERN